MWDPAAGGGNGDYVNLNCAAVDVHIAPFQAFWVRTTDNNPVLEIPEAAYLESADEGYFKELHYERSAMSPKDIADLGQAPGGFIFSLDLQGNDGLFTNNVHILFSEQGTEGMDRFDSPKLSPAGLAGRYLSFYALDENQKAYAFRSLPQHLAEQVTIPLGIETTEPGSYTLSWPLPRSDIFGGSYYLRDTHTETGQTSKVSTRPDRFQKPVRSSDSPRFELIVTTSELDVGGGELPQAVALNQNYPNPFNPSTIISYELPEAGQVRLNVYDMTGRQVATLVDTRMNAGRHQVSFNAMNLASGVYMYRLQAGGVTMTRQLTLIK